MEILDKNDKKSMIRLARSVIRSELFESAEIERPEEISDCLREERGSFVTLHMNNMLRGCIGTIEPVRPLIEDIEVNALNAAFKDPRFSPLTKNELSKIDIEISVLTKPTVLPFKDPKELIKKLKPGIHGVIISQGWRSATFLPQVWEQLADKKTFLEHLCQKGGMGKACWKDRDTIIKIYTVECFSEASPE